ncbi:MAG: AAA family ATPase [Candidatus Peregrinibacteria bacterium]
MFLNSLTIENFKGFTKTQIKFVPGVNILVGPNNCGKSSILQAVFLAFRFLDHYQLGKKDKKPDDIGVSIKDEEFHLPYPDRSYISTNLKKQTQFKNPHTGFLLDVFISSEKENHKVKIETLFSGNNTNIYVSKEEGFDRETAKKDLEKVIGNEEFREINARITEEKICFVPLFAGLLAKEGGLTDAKAQESIWKGRSNEVLRNKILRMDENDFHVLQNTIQETFGINLSKAEEHGADLESHYFEIDEEGKPKKVSFDVFAGGSGFQQILHLLVYILSSKADIVLVDEPDAHLHFDLQKKMFQALRRISLEGKKQIIIATHSFEVIHEGMEHGDTKVFFVDKNSDYQESVNDKSELARNLYESGIIGAKTLQEFTDKMTFLVVENEKEGKSIVEKFFTKKFPQKIRDPLFQIIEGKGNGTVLEHALAYQADSNEQQITRIFLRDSDALTEEEKKKIIESEKLNDLKKIFYLEEFEVENWLLNSQVIARLISKRKQLENLLAIPEEDIKKLIQEVFDAFGSIEGIRILEKKIRGRFRSHKGILFPNRSNEDFDTQSEEESQKRTDQILKSSFTEKIKNMPGKEVFKRLKQKISENFKIQISELDVAEEFLVEEIPSIFNQIKAVTPE